MKNTTIFSMLMFGVVAMTGWAEDDGTASNASAFDDCIKAAESTELTVNNAIGIDTGLGSFSIYIDTHAGRYLVVDCRRTEKAWGLALREVDLSSGKDPRQSGAKLTFSKRYRLDCGVAKNLGDLFANIEMSQLQSKASEGWPAIARAIYMVRIRKHNASKDIVRGELFPPFVNSMITIPDLGLPKKVAIDSQEAVLRFLCFVAIDRSTDGEFSFFDNSWKQILDTQGRPKSSEKEK